MFEEKLFPKQHSQCWLNFGSFCVRLQRHMWVSICITWFSPSVPFPSVRALIDSISVWISSTRKKGKKLVNARLALATNDPFPDSPLFLSSTSFDADREHPKRAAVLEVV